MAKRKQAAEAATLEIPVNFGGVSIGDGTARLGLKIDREVLNLDRADECLCGRRLRGKVLLGNGDSKQSEFIDDRLHSIASVFDVKRFGVAPKEIGCGLTFSLQEIDVKELSLFAKKTGKLIVYDVAAIPDGEAGDDEGEGDDDGN